MFKFIKRLFGVVETPKDNKEQMLREYREKYLEILHKDVKEKPRKVTATSDYKSRTSYNSTPSTNNDSGVLDTVANAMIISELLSNNDPVPSDSLFINEDSHGFDNGFGGGDFSGGGSGGSWDDSSSSYDSSSSDSSSDSFSSSDW